jgi:hypothetical protein
MGIFNKADRSASVDPVLERSLIVSPQMRLRAVSQMIQKRDEIWEDLRSINIDDSSSFEIYFHASRDGCFVVFTSWGLNRSYCRKPYYVMDRTHQTKVGKMHSVIVHFIQPEHIFPDDGFRQNSDSYLTIDLGNSAEDSEIAATLVNRIERQKELTTTSRRDRAKREGVGPNPFIGYH